MRTTLTLEDDVDALLARVRKTQKKTLKATVNEALRLGLEQMVSPRKAKKRYRTGTASLGRCLVANLDDVGEVLAIAEGESFR
jgi:hypothetical protein